MFNERVRTASSPQRFKYNDGAERQESLGVDFTKYRVYDPAMERWWQIDPLSDIDVNLRWTPYNYSYNSPILYNDPNGDCPCIVPALPYIAAGIEALLVAGGAYYNAADNFYSHAPGSKYEYSNMASALIGVLVEAISGEDFDTYCSKHIFQPLEMSNTYWSLDKVLQSGTTLVKPYDYANGGFEAIQHYTFPDYPNGALRSTARDMMKFLAALSQNGRFNNFQLLNSNTVNQMLTAQIPHLDASIGLHALILDKESNIWGHDGSEQGVSTEVGFNRSNGVGVIILSNLQDVDVSSILLEAYNFGLNL